MHDTSGVECVRLPTQRQMDYLRAIQGYTDAHGIPPTIRELNALLGTTSTYGMRDMLLALERKGLVARMALKSRALVVTDAGRRLLGARKPHAVRKPQGAWSFQLTCGCSVGYNGDDEVWLVGTTSHPICETGRAAFNLEITRVGKPPDTKSDSGLTQTTKLVESARSPLSGDGKQRNPPAHDVDVQGADRHDGGHCDGEDASGGREVGSGAGVGASAGGGVG